MAVFGRDDRHSRLLLIKPAWAGVPPVSGRHTRADVHDPFGHRFYLEDFPAHFHNIFTIVAIPSWWFFSYGASAIIWATT